MVRMVARLTVGPKHL